MLGFNDQNARVLLGIPFGVAWVAAGHAVWSAEDEQRALVELRAQ